MSITSNANSTFLNVDNAHLRVAGDIHATSVKVGAIEIVPGYSLESTTGIGNTTPHTVEFKNTETSLVTSGDINMLHSSNNAAIKLNSNVVTEFPRSKKLIKYPRVALTSASQDGYVASASTTYDLTGYYDGYRVFDGTRNRWSSEYPTYTDNDGGYIGDETTTIDGTGYLGEWVQIQLPEKIRLVESHVLRNGTDNNLSTNWNYRSPYAGYIAGSNDGTHWSLVDLWSSAPSVPHVREVNSNTYYKYFRLIVNKIHNFSGGTLAQIGEWELYGIPEYDPDADGADVKVTSYPNVPNTDWLEVYYDAKNLADGAVTSVDDLTPSGTNDGTATNVTVSDGAFVFNGTNSKITTSTTLSDGACPHTICLWYYTNDDPSTLNDYLFQLGDNTENNSPAISINNAIFYVSFYSNYLMTSVSATGIQSKKWVQITYSYDGGATTSNNPAVYIDGKQIAMTGPLGNSAGSALSLVLGTDPNLHLTIGSRRTDVSHVNGKIANFRLFNRALTSDEIWQLYAYQKEYFGHGDLSMTLKAGRLGIGTSEPRAALDVRGDVAGPFTTFLTGDVTTSIVTSIPSTSTIYPITSYTFDVPREYHIYGTKNLEIYGQVKWSGEAQSAWNAMFSLRLYYGDLTTHINSAENTSTDANTRNNGAGVIAVSHHSDFGSTIDSCIVGSRFYIPNCPVSPGSQLKLELRIRQGNQISDVYTNRTKNDNTGDPNYERGTTNFFLVVK
jgi:hypothetical protein